MQNLYEKLGLFYLGQKYNLRARQLEEELILYDSRDLVTHAVCVGMTGSGKTGLGITLLEEAAIDGIPSLVIDPKGDLTNLLLNFPELRSDDFRPWIQPNDAQRLELTTDQLAEKTAQQWREGLAAWGQSPDRIRRLGQACDFTILTPGSDAGVPVSILSSLDTPPDAVLADADLLRDQTATMATSLLSLLGINADPLRSREHILMTTILDHCWRMKVSLDLSELIRLLQNPPVSRVGVMDLDTFYPSKDRFELAMALNNLLAAPSFSAWLSGEPLDVNRLLYTAEGRPRVSIFYIAHLSESERQFFTALLLNQTLGWMRSQRGTHSLRALLYIDELYGYMPPVAEPPTKKPLLTLLKQARAYGLGLVLATQNPVDLDYKGLSNTGTWFLGRLQTERDKERVLDGLEGTSLNAGGAFDRTKISEILSGLGKRVFLMHNVHEDEPVIFHTRWALSYLAGPLTRTQIKQLMAGRREPDIDVPPSGVDTRPPSADASPPRSDEVTSGHPVLPPDVPQVFLVASAARSPVRYRPHLVGLARMHYIDSRKGLSASEDLILLTPLEDTAFGVDWTQAEELEVDPDDLLSEPRVPGTFEPLPSAAGQSRSYAGWSKSLAEHLYRTRRFPLLQCATLKAVSEPGEDERDFRIRLAMLAREMRNEQCEQLRQKYASKLRTLEDRVRRAEQKVDRERNEASGAKMQSIISFGATVLSSVLGRKRISSTTVSRASTAARGATRAGATSGRRPSRRNPIWRRIENG